MLFKQAILLSALSTVTYATPTHLTSFAIRDNYPTNIGNPSYCEKVGICNTTRLPNSRTQCTDDEKLICQYYSCNVAWSECQDYNSFASCSNALNQCEPVGGRPISDKDCAKLFTGYDGSVCMDCTSGINGRCHINPEAYKQFSEGDACKKSTEQCVDEDSCNDALFDCEYVGGPKISEDKCKYVIIGSKNDTGVPMEVACEDCTSYQNGMCLLDEMNLEAFEQDYELV
ncbi:hypothetical protein N7526_000170 [Penicillium atrosanguineum]|nr:hypothetical protein N7526_000170 [Penicillium atrosanguineum]